MNMHLETNGLDAARENQAATGAEVREPAGRADASDLVHFLEDVSTFLSRKDEAV